MTKINYADLIKQSTPDDYPLMFEVAEMPKGDDKHGYRGWGLSLKTYTNNLIPTDGPMTFLIPNKNEATILIKKGKGELTETPTFIVNGTSIVNKTYTPLTTTRYIKKLFEGTKTKLNLLPITKYMSGADPEVFVMDAKGVVVPAFTFLKDKKVSPTVFWDGFQAEFTVQPQSCVSFLVDSVRQGLIKIATAMPKGAKLSPLPVFDVAPDVLAKCEDVHVRLGCDPSLNVYNRPGQIVEDGRTLPWRFAGSHKHYGIGAKHSPEVIARVVKTLDAIYGVGLVSLCATFDRPERRIFYGRAGEYRLPPHGLEYRVPSSMDLCDPAVYHLSWDLGRFALHLGLGKFSDIWKATEDEVVETINNCDYKQARKILKRNEKMLTTILNWTTATIFTTDNRMGAARFHVLVNGLESLVSDPLDMKTNWNLSGTWTGHSNSDKDCFVGRATSRGLLSNIKL